jgi:hydrogenase maturation protease
MNATASAIPPIDLWEHPSTLVFAIGNSGRQDDGLGWALGERLAADTRFTGAVAFRYQLQVEDAELLSAYQRVVFVDASKDKLADGVAWFRAEPAGAVAFSTHALSPGTVLQLAKELYEVDPEAWILAIAGTEWELEIGLSTRASKHLERAWEGLTRVCT